MSTTSSTTTCSTTTCSTTTSDTTSDTTSGTDATVPVGDLVNYGLSLYMDIEEALQLAGEPDWASLVDRGASMGWREDAAGWLVGRRFAVLFEPASPGFHVSELNLDAGAFTCSLRKPQISVCHSPCTEFPTLHGLLCLFEQYRKECRCPRQDAHYLMVAHSVLSAWFADG